MPRYLGHRPCPACKSDNLNVCCIERYDGTNGYWIRCSNCGYELDGICDSRAQAWVEWNKIKRDDDEFKPCFICCGDIEYGKLETTGKYWVKCTVCGNYIELDANALDDAINEWNDIELIENELEVNRCNKCGCELIDLIKWCGYYVVKCRKCGYYGGWLGDSKESSIKEWNKANKDKDENELIKESGDFKFNVKKKVTATGEWYVLNVTGWDEDLLSVKITMSSQEIYDLMMLLREAIDIKEGLFRCECGNEVFEIIEFSRLDGYPVYDIKCSKCGTKYEINGSKYINAGNVFIEV